MYTMDCCYILYKLIYAFFLYDIIIPQLSTCLSELFLFVSLQERFPALSRLHYCTLFLCDFNI